MSIVVGVWVRKTKSYKSRIDHIIWDRSIMKTIGFQPTASRWEYNSPFVLRITQSAGRGRAHGSVQSTPTPTHSPTTHSSWEVPRPVSPWFMSTPGRRYETVTAGFIYRLPDPFWRWVRFYMICAVLISPSLRPGNTFSRGGDECDCILLLCIWFYFYSNTPSLFIVIPVRPRQ